MVPHDEEELVSHEVRSRATSLQLRTARLRSYVDRVNGRGARQSGG